MSETTARVVVAIPWIIFAIAIVGAGGLLFTLALVVLAILGLREFFRMAEPEQPIMLPGYAVAAGMVIAAHYGAAFQILLVFAAIFPLTFVFAAARRSHEAITISIAFTILGVAWMGIGFSHAVLLRDLPLHGGRPAHRRAGGHLPRRHRRLRGGPALRVAEDHAAHLAQQDAGGADRRLRRGDPGLLVRRPLPGLAARHRRPADGHGDRGDRADRGSVRLPDQARPRRQGHRQPLRAPRWPDRPPGRRALHRGRSGTTWRSPSCTDGYVVWADSATLSGPCRPSSALPA